MLLERCLSIFSARIRRRVETSDRCFLRLFPTLLFHRVTKVPRELQTRRENDRFCRLAFYTLARVFLNCW